MRIRNKFITLQLQTKKYYPSYDFTLTFCFLCYNTSENVCLQGHFHAVFHREREFAECKFFAKAKKDPFGSALRENLGGETAKSLPGCKSKSLPLAKRKVARLTRQVIGRADK